MRMMSIVGKLEEIICLLLYPTFNSGSSPRIQAPQRYTLGMACLIPDLVTFYCRFQCWFQS